ncbi:2OG-Fe(II) oxygenase [Sphingomonas flavescens]|uniref:2OG-Fe(II) oxygenase n=1 Tax=Sphingomonas flavescens TaxID=3132797 RepID=UPI0028056DD7|nr:2OG-Fe(II) oxygenase [Sphingomonas limnosediminicola]
MLHLAKTGGYLAFNEEECLSFGRSLSEKYRNAEPFPHIVIDNFMEAEPLRAVLGEFPSNRNKDFFDREQERLKFQFEPNTIDSGVIRNLFAELNSRAFLSFLEELTGITGLIPDPRFEGGGLHETKRGGHLGVHADFNVNDRLKVQRRLNLLIYLNDDWPDEYGGQLELWDKQMQRCAVRVSPIFGRAVIFNTDLDSFHGHPDPLNCPPERSRRSIATYYYSAPEEGLVALPKRTTNFRARPGSTDKADWRIRRHHLVNDWVPPRLQRFAHRLFG